MGRLGAHSTLRFPVSRAVNKLFGVCFCLDVLAHNKGLSLIENAMNFTFWNTIKLRLGEYWRRQFGRNKDSSYPCITCGLPDSADPIDKRIDDRLMDGWAVMMTGSNQDETIHGKRR